MKMYYKLLPVYREVAPDGSERLVAVLKRRGEENCKTKKPESWPGVCEFAVIGEQEPGDESTSALYLATKEELGESFAGSPDAWADTFDLMVNIGQAAQEDKIIIHLAFEVTPSKLDLIRLNRLTGGQRDVRQSDLKDIQAAPNWNCKEEDGTFARRTIAMFPDEIEALGRAFETFEHRSDAENAEVAVLAEHMRKVASRLPPPNQFFPSPQ